MAVVRPQLVEPISRNQRSAHDDVHLLVSVILHWMFAEKASLGPSARLDIRGDRTRQTLGSVRSEPRENTSPAMQLNVLRLPVFQQILVDGISWAWALP